MNKDIKAGNYPSYKLVMDGNIVRYLPKVKLNETTTIAAFNSMGDTQLVLKVCDQLEYQIAKNNLKIDIIVTTECKGIPYAARLAQLLGINFVVLRKEDKVYLEDSFEFNGESITSGKTKYYLSDTDMTELMFKQVLIVDDVFSTGKTVDSILDVLEYTVSIPVGIAVAVVEGSKRVKQYKDLPLYSCGRIPLFKNKRV